MRIMHVITSLESHGAQQVLVQLLETSDRVQYESVVVSLMDEGLLGEKIKGLGIQLETVGMKRGMVNPFSLYKLRKIMKGVKPDLVQGWMYHGNFAAYIAAADKYPLLWCIHHSLYELHREKLLTQLLIRLECRLSGAPDRIIYCSQKSADEHMEMGFDRSRTVLIPNGFNTDTFHPCSDARSSLIDKLGLPDDALIVGHAARYHPMKNHAGLLQAFARLVTRHPGVFLVMAGSGIDEKNDDLNRVIKDLDLGDRVRLLGEQRNMAIIMPAFDIYISSSSWGEAFPMVIGEAMASGVPCLATDIGDSALLIDDTGYVVPPVDPDALADGLDKMLNLEQSERRELGQKARQRICDNFSLVSMSKKYTIVYDSVITDTSK